jgi:carbon-monoxide dehydrogenase small subunit
MAGRCGVATASMSRGGAWGTRASQRRGYNESAFAFATDACPVIVVALGHGGLLKQSVTIRVNGIDQRHEVEPRLLLVHFLRDLCGLTGTHIGCETSICGACTVSLNGMAVKSCTIFAVQADGAEITTIEGLSKDRELHPVQQAFWEKHGLQCGYCTPGMIMAGLQILQRNPRPSREEIAHGLEGNLCRCTGYSHIIDAIESVTKGGKS